MPEPFFGICFPVTLGGGLPSQGLPGGPVYPSTGPVFGGGGGHPAHPLPPEGQPGSPSNPIVPVDPSTPGASYIWIFYPGYGVIKVPLPPPSKPVDPAQPKS